MPSPTYDAIVIGARCAGSPTAMLLAQRGHKVLLVDRATFPSDTVSTHLIHPPGMAALKRWGLDEALIASGSPPIGTYSFDFGPIKIAGSPGTPDAPLSYGPRRTVLDKLLVDAAAAAGVEVREAFTIEKILLDGGRVTGVRGHTRGGRNVSASARVVVGADGRNSKVARSVNAAQYNEKPEIEASYYSYWSGLPMNGRSEMYLRGNRGFAAWPTNDGQTLVVGGWPYSEFEKNRKDVEGNFMRSIDMVPEFADRMRAAKREERFVGAAVPNFFRKPFGPGWALVGDAGYNKDFVTAQGISDAFRDAESCAAALDSWLSGARGFDEAMGEYQEARDRHVMPMYEYTAEVARFEPPPPEQQQLMSAMSGNQTAMNGFAQVFAGVTSPAEFFSEANVSRIFSGSA